MLYTSVGSHLSLCAFVLNVIIDTRLSKESISPTA